MHGHIIFITLMSFCYLQTSHAADKGYNEDCTVGTDTCTAADTECRTENTVTKCLCKTAGHWVANQGNTACVCDAANFWQLDTTNNACTCAPTYLLDSSTCRATIGTTVCTAKGNECSTATDSYCDATALKCNCPAITTAATNGCTYKECTTGAVCEAVDPNSECSGSTNNDKCQCKTGHTLGSNGKCAAGSGAAGVLVSLAMLLACTLTTLF